MNSFVSEVASNSINGSAGNSIMMLQIT